MRAPRKSKEELRKEKEAKSYIDKDYPIKQQFKIILHEIIHALERGEKALELQEIGKEISENEKIFCKFCQSVRQSGVEGEGVLKDKN